MENEQIFPKKKNAKAFSVPNNELALTKRFVWTLSIKRGRSEDQGFLFSLNRSSSIFFKKKKMCPGGWGSEVRHLE
jgi:hypothetical protein